MKSFTLVVFALMVAMAITVNARSLTLDQEPKEEAKPTCGTNAQYVQCGTNCPMTCANFRNPPQACNFACFAGCRCKEGFVFREGTTGDCVRESECA